MNNTVVRPKRPPFSIMESIIEPLQKEFSIRFFAFNEIPHAVVWAERGNIAIHENYHSRRRQSYHVICSEKDNLLRLCQKIGIPSSYVTASEFYKFWHMTWFPKTEYNHVFTQGPDFQEELNP